MIPINYHHLYYFYVIAKSGSLTKACQTLLLAQPTLSAQLKQLETTMKCKLFERRKQRLYLTDEGRFVLDYAESIFELGQELQDALRDRTPTGKIDFQVGILNGTPRSFSQALIECALQCPHAGHVSAKEGSAKSLITALREHHIDAILTDISIPESTSSDYENHLIAKFPIYFVGARSWQKKLKHFPTDLEQVPLILPSSPSQIYEQVLGLFSNWKIKPRIVADVQDVEVARRLAISGHGVVPLNAYTLSRSFPRHALQNLFPTQRTGLFETIYFVTRTRKYDHPVSRYLKTHLKLHF